MEKGTTPDVLVMTATPIPRTLSLTLYGDLDISVIDQMPPGRVPIETRWSAPEHLPGVWDFLRREIKTGRQAYVVYPVIEQSKSAEAQRSLKAAIVEYERLRKSVFPESQGGPAAWPDEERGKRSSHGGVSPAARSRFWFRRR